MDAQAGHHPVSARSSPSPSITTRTRDARGRNGAIVIAQAALPTPHATKGKERDDPLTLIDRRTILICSPTKRADSQRHSQLPSPESPTDSLAPTSQ